MKTIYQSRVWDIHWHPEIKCLHFVFQEYTQKMRSGEYLKELKGFIELIKEHQPKSIFADTREFYFTIVSDIQEFINQNILALYSEVGVEKHAILVSPDIFTAISIELTMEEDEQPSYENRYFDNEAAVKAWLGL